MVKFRSRHQGCTFRQKWSIRRRQHGYNTAVQQGVYPAIRRELAALGHSTAQNYAEICGKFRVNNCKWSVRGWNHMGCDFCELRARQASINGQQYQFQDGISVLDACRSAGIAIATLCHDDRLKPIGGCRMCLVEIRESRVPFRPVTPRSLRECRFRPILLHLRMSDEWF